jgi:hypothetical protein
MHINGSTQADGVRQQDAEEEVGPKMAEVTGSWRKWLNKELHDLYSSPNYIWAIK